MPTHPIRPRQKEFVPNRLNTRFSQVGGPSASFYKGNRRGTAEGDFFERFVAKNQNFVVFILPYFTLELEKISSSYIL